MIPHDDRTPTAQNPAKHRRKKTLRIDRGIHLNIAALLPVNANQFCNSKSSQIKLDAHYAQTHTHRPGFCMQYA